jgi:hypothetical protein
LLGSLYEEARAVFEFGVGESTYVAAEVGVPRYVGVDSDIKWVEMARQNAAQDHFRFYVADIGETLKWGFPRKRVRKIKLDYQLGALEMEKEPFDVYMIDGRYRMACALASFMHAISRGADMATVKVAIHDYQNARRGYGAVRKVANVVNNTKKLHVFKLKSNVTEEVLFQMWQTYSTIPKR